MSEILEVRAVGVAMEGRQTFIQRGISYGEDAVEFSLEIEPDNQYDQYAVKVKMAVGNDVYQVGYLPRNRCPYCDVAWTAKYAEATVCPDCGAQIVGEKANILKTFNKFVGEALTKGFVISVRGEFRIPKGRGNYGIMLFIEVDGCAYESPEKESFRED